MIQKKYLRTEDVCVACGAPVTPGDQICTMCQKMVDLSPGTNRPPRVKEHDELKKKVGRLRKLITR